MSEPVCMRPRVPKLLHSAVPWICSCLVLFTLVGCGEVSKARRALGKVGAEELRKEVLVASRESFASGGVQRIPETNWPASTLLFHPLGLWAEPDGAYLLIESDVAGERGLYLPRVLSEKD